MRTKTFHQLSKNDTAIAGGKGASLGEMINAGIPVPAGFVILASAFERFLNETDLAGEISVQLKKVNYDDVNSVDRASNVIRDLIHDAKMPEDLQKEIMKNYVELFELQPHLDPSLKKGRKIMREAHFVAVRSSATAEDSSVASWAGELEGYLNTNKNNLLENVRNCWSSLFTPRAIFYRREKKLLETHVSVAVVVQKMIQSEVSGICFTVHPVTEDRNQMIIEAGFGLGEAIVGGLITPDSYVVDKKERSILDKNISRQEMMIARDKNGTKEIAVSKDKQDKQKLSDQENLELAEICQKIENHYGFPCDIEWAFKNGKFYIVQSRPITTLISKIENNKEKQIFIKEHSREYSLLKLFAWNYAANKGIKKLLGVGLGESCAILHGRGLIEVYYEKSNLKKFHLALERMGSENEKIIRIYIKKFLEIFKKLEKYYLGNKRIKNINDLKILYNLYCDYWTYLAIIYNLPEKYSVKKRIRDLAYEARLKTQEHNESIESIFSEFLISLFSLRNHEDVFISPEELWKKNISKKEIIEIIRKRKKGFVLHKEGLYVGKISIILSELGIELEKENKNVKEIKGDVAQGGKVVGVVKKILGEKDLSNFKEHNVLVTAMTMPRYLPIMKQSIAVITDEGGITCHAAIVSRELKKPCIIGTKIATQVLHDGDLVEVDADKGMVKIIKKAKK